MSASALRIDSTRAKWHTDTRWSSTTVPESEPKIMSVICICHVLVLIIRAKICQQQSRFGMHENCSKETDQEKADQYILRNCQTAMVQTRRRKERTDTQESHMRFADGRWKGKTVKSSDPNAPTNLLTR